MIEKPVKFCPALPRLCYQPVRTTEGKAVADIRARLQKHQAVVLSGVRLNDFTANQRIRKTSLMRERLIPELAKENLVGTMVDCEDLLDIEAIMFYPELDFHGIVRRAQLISESSDVYVIDEVHHMFPRSNYPDELNEALLVFWAKLASLLAKGKKIIFVTAAHPLNDIFRNCSVNKTMNEFFTAPVVELPARR